MHSILKEEGYPVALRSSLVAMVTGSIGSSQYLSLYVVKEQEGDRIQVDAIGNGRFACALYVSSLLDPFRLLSAGIHTNVAETEEDLLASGWYYVPEPISGSVIIWGPKLASDGKPHRHIGFSLGDERAVSTDGKTGQPTEHHITFGETDGRPTRPIEAIFFHERLHW